MIKAGVIGHPAAHSKSPLIHNYWFDKHQIDGEYTAIDIAPEELETSVQKLVDEDYAGFNVTVPHKVAVMSLCDTLDETATAIGAVNTVTIKDGKLHGRNTDAFGFIENLKTVLPSIYFSTPVMVLGAGGAARAVIYALLQAGVPRIHLANRSKDKAEILALMAPEKIDVVDWAYRSSLQDCGLIVNTTSLGMKGQEALEIDLSALRKPAAVCDIVYSPLMTDLLRAAQAGGHPIVTGIGMLLHQARPAFEAWTGVMPNVDQDLMKKVLA